MGYTEDDDVTPFLDTIQRTAVLLTEMSHADYLYLDQHSRRAADDAIDFVVLASHGLEVITAENDASSLSPRERMSVMLASRVLKRMDVAPDKAPSVLSGVQTVLRLLYMGKSMRAKEHVFFSVACTFFTLLNLPTAIMKLVKDADVPTRWWTGGSKPD